MDHCIDGWHVDVISISFGFSERWPQISNAVKRAYDKNVVVLAAPSNDGSIPEDPIAYPTAETGHVICVNSADPWGNNSVFNPPLSAKGDNFSIYGENVKSTWPEDADRVRATQDHDGT